MRWTCVLLFADRPVSESHAHPRTTRLNERVQWLLLPHALSHAHGQLLSHRSFTISHHVYAIRTR